MAKIIEYLNSHGGVNRDNAAQILAIYHLNRLKIDQIEMENIALRAKLVAAQLDARKIEKEQKKP